MSPVNWNNELTELNYYLTNLYIRDFKNDRKFSLIVMTGLSAAHIPIVDDQQLTWFNILFRANQENKVADLLETVIGSDFPNDEFLKGYIQLLRSGQKSKVLLLNDSEWKGDWNFQVGKEKIIGKKSTLLPIAFLEQGVEAAKAVVRIVLEEHNEVGTGFLLENRWLLTNNHVLPDIKTAASAVIEFNYQLPKYAKISKHGVNPVKAEYTTSLTPGTASEPLFFTDEKEDWTLVKMDDQGVDVYGFFTLAAPGLAKDDFVNIIQHPLGGPKQIGLYQNLVMYVDNEVIQYMTDTNDGSSGSPVVNSDWEVVAVHHGGGWIKDPETGQMVKRNQGTNIERIKIFMNKEEFKKIKDVVR